MHFTVLSVSSSLLGAMMLFSSANVNAQSVTRSPQGFVFDCDHDVCPDGPYQQVCPQCDDIEYPEDNASALQCYCFDSNKQLQGGSTIRDSQNCNVISADDTGALVCTINSGKLRKGKKNKVSKSKNDVATTESATAAPTVPSGNVVHVDFNFNCVGGTCPDGEYQQFCPRCVVNTDSTPPNDPDNSISCNCFNTNGQMLLRTSTMWNFDKCPEIVVSAGGELSCKGATRKDGIRTYGGR